MYGFSPGKDLIAHVICLVGHFGARVYVKLGHKIINIYYAMKNFN